MIMTIDDHALVTDMLEYMNAVKHRDVYRGGTQMYDHHNHIIEYIENKWKDVMVEYLSDHKPKILKQG